MKRRGSDPDTYSDEEATRRMNEALRRALTSPPKPQSEMKLGKGSKQTDKAKMRPSSKGRVPRLSLDSM